MEAYSHPSAPARANVDSVLAQLRRALKDRNHHDWHRRFFARDASRVLVKLVRVLRGQAARCKACGGELEAGRNESKTCQACRRMGADMAFSEALATVRGLQSGQPPFDVLTPQERREQLDALMGDSSPDAITRAEIERPVDFAHLDLAEFARPPRPEGMD